MNLIFGMKVIYLMRLDSLVKIVVERCTRNTTKVPTVWNINYQIIKNNNTTTQKRHRGVFPRCFSYWEKGAFFTRGKKRIQTHVYKRDNPNYQTVKRDL